MRFKKSDEQRERHLRRLPAKGRQAATEHCAFRQNELYVTNRLSVGERA